MPSHGSVAASVRRDKEANPHKYCRDPRCLWRIAQRDGWARPCPKHEMTVSQRRESECDPE